MITLSFESSSQLKLILQENGIRIIWHIERFLNVSFKTVCVSHGRDEKLIIRLSLIGHNQKPSNMTENCNCQKI